MTQKRVKATKSISEKLLKLITTTLSDEKAEEIVQIDLRGRTEIADYMIICSGRSTRQVSALSEKIIDLTKTEFKIISKTEGKSQGDWVLIDSGDVITNIFRPEVRDFYQLEKLWSQNEILVDG